jgi:hypothetical protein
MPGPTRFERRGDPANRGKKTHPVIGASSHLAEPAIGIAFGAGGQEPLPSPLTSPLVNQHRQRKAKQGRRRCSRCALSSVGAPGAAMSCGLNLPGGMLAEVLPPGDTGAAPWSRERQGYRVLTCSIIVPRRSNGAHLHRPWRATRRRRSARIAAAPAPDRTAESGLVCRYRVVGAVGSSRSRARAFDSAPRRSGCMC